MRLKPFLIGPNGVERKWPPGLTSNRLLGGIGIHWGRRDAPEPSGTLAVWLFRSHHRYARSPRLDGTKTELYRFRSYDLHIGGVSRYVRIPLVGPSNRPRRRLSPCPSLP